MINFGIKIGTILYKWMLVSFASIFLILCGCKNNQGIVNGTTNNSGNNSEWHFAIIPHFMLDSDKVDQFYNYIKNNYSDNADYSPDKVLLISPNHFHKEIKTPITICESNDVGYNNKSIFLDNNLGKLGIPCDINQNIFYSRGKSIRTHEHGLGEHFQWIVKYFKNSNTLPLVLNSYGFDQVDQIINSIKSLTGNILVIASVDFAHYQPEDITKEHDNQSIKILESGSIEKKDFLSGIDADCPACLYLIQLLANKNNQKAQLRWRDSSSTILHRDLGENNTSRIFIEYK